MNDEEWFAWMDTNGDGEIERKDYKPKPLGDSVGPPDSGDSSNPISAIDPRPLSFDVVRAHLFAKDSRLNLSAFLDRLNSKSKLMLAIEKLSNRERGPMMPVTVQERGGTSYIVYMPL